MVILTEDSLPWSPLAVMTKEKDISPRKQLRVKTNWAIDKKYLLNVFEAPIENVSLIDVLGEQCLPHLGDLTKMAATRIYGKKFLKIFFS